MNNNQDFIVIAGDLARNKELTWSVKITFAKVTALAAKDGVCKASYRRLEHFTGLGRTTVIGAIAGLTARGLLKDAEYTWRGAKRKNGLAVTCGSVSGAVPVDGCGNGTGKSTVPGTPSENTSDKEVLVCGGGAAGAGPASETGATPTPSETAPVVTQRHYELAKDWGGQVRQFMTPSRKSPVPPLSHYQSRPQDMQAVLELAVKAYPGADPHEAFRHAIRGCAATQMKRDRMRDNANDRVFGAGVVDIRLCLFTGPKGSLLRASPALYRRQPPEPIDDAQRQAVTTQDEYNVSRFLCDVTWPEALWRKSMIEIAARVRLYEMPVEAYLRCADALNKIYPEMPYLWIADSLTREEVAAYRALKAERGEPC